MKLIIQIPCFNEAQTLPGTLRDLPRQVAGFDQVEHLVIDDGSTDGTAEVARVWGVEHVVQHATNRGLAATFTTGIETALRLGADVIVNTDADNQYPGGDIPRLVQPILRGEADLVIGDRQTWTNPHFSPLKRFLQQFGSRVVSLFAGQPIPDAVSGFRALSREAALKLHVVTSFSYTIDTVMQAAYKSLAIRSVPITTNAPTRSSRLYRSVPQYLFHSGLTILRVYAMYYPRRALLYAGLLLTFVAGLPTLYAWLMVGGQAAYIFLATLSGIVLLAGCVAYGWRVLVEAMARARGRGNDAQQDTVASAWRPRCLHAHDDPRHVGSARSWARRVANIPPRMGGE